MQRTGRDFELYDKNWTTALLLAADALVAEISINYKNNIIVKHIRST